MASLIDVESMEAENRHQEGSDIDEQTSYSRNANGQLGNRKCQALRVLPLLFVGVGCLVIVFGQMLESTVCIIAGPIIVAFGGLQLLLIVLCNPGRRNHKENTNNNESTVRDRVSSGEAVSRPNFLELRFPLDSCAIDMVPPSYEEAVCGKECAVDKDLSTSSCHPQDRQDFGDLLGSDPPSYQDCVAHAGSKINPIASDHTAEFC